MTTFGEQWQDLGKAGLLGVGFPSRFGGQGGGPAEVWRTARRVGERAFDLSIGLSWISHQIAARFLLGQYGSEDQKAAWLPRLATGEAVAAIAVDEAETEPSRWNLRARYRPTTGGHFVLEGKKLSVINGPVADLLLYFAVARTEGELDGLQAFLVHRDTPGVTMEELEGRSYCPYSPQSNVILRECFIPEASALGTRAQCRDMLEHIGEQHDVLVLQVITGFLERMVQELRPLLRRSDRDRLLALSLRGRLMALGALNRAIAKRWEDRAEDPATFAAAQMAARELIQVTRQDLGDLPDHPAVLAAQRDLELISLAWPRTKGRFIAAVRAEETDEHEAPPRA